MVGAERFSGQPERRTGGHGLEVSWPTVTAVNWKSYGGTLLPLVAVSLGLFLIAWFGDDNRGWGILAIVTLACGFSLIQPVVARRRPNRLTVADGQLSFIPPEPFLARDPEHVPLDRIVDVRVEERSRPAMMRRGRGGPAWSTAVTSYDLVAIETSGVERMIARAFLDENHALGLRDDVVLALTRAGVELGSATRSGATSDDLDASIERLSVTHTQNGHRVTVAGVPRLWVQLIFGLLLYLAVGMSFFVLSDSELWPASVGAVIIAVGVVLAWWRERRRAIDIDVDLSMIQVATVRRSLLGRRRRFERSQVSAITFGYGAFIVVKGSRPGGWRAAAVAHHGGGGARIGPGLSVAEMTLFRQVLDRAGWPVDEFDPNAWAEAHVVRGRYYQRDDRLRASDGP